MNEQSTSTHTFSADPGLTIAGKLKYLAVNWQNNQQPYEQVSPDLKIVDFRLDNLEQYTDQMEQTSSPSRTLSNLFWVSRPWAQLAQELGEIHLYDAGCGSGNYGVRLLETSGGRLETYTGVDLATHENWAKLEQARPNFHFQASDAKTMGTTIPADTNFFISQSFIEHIPEDLGFFRQVKDYITGYKKPVWQMHLFPSAACLPLYMWHGVRQYTPRTVSKIAQLFVPNSEVVLYRVGGRAATTLHWQTVTLPWLMRQPNKARQNPEAYRQQLWQAIKQDMKSPQLSPAFYALTIHTPAYDS